MALIFRRTPDSDPPAYNLMSGGAHIAYIRQERLGDHGGKWGWSLTNHFPEGGVRWRSVGANAFPDDRGSRFRARPARPFRRPRSASRCRGLLVSEASMRSFELGWLT